MPEYVFYNGNVVASLLTEDDVPENYLINNHQKLSIIGYGSQGRGQSLNHRDSGVDVHLGLREGGKSWEYAVNDDWVPGENLHPVGEAAEIGDIVQLLVPDMEQKRVWEEDIREHLVADNALAFSHGFNITTERIKPPEDVDVIMVAPKGPGAIVRQQYEAGFGVPSLFAVNQDYTGKAKDRVLGMAKSIGSTKPGILETSFNDETMSDLFGEQVDLCGGVTELANAAFETLIEKGYNPVLAYWETHHELFGLIAPLSYNFGSAGMLRRVSDTAKDGAFTSGKRVIDKNVKKNMKAVLSDIESQKYMNGWIKRYDEKGRNAVTEKLEALDKHPIEIVGKQVRQIMWPDKQVD